MKSSLTTKIYKKQLFNSGLISILINPFYFVRKGLLKGIKENAAELQGYLLDFGCGVKPYREYFKVDKYVGVDVINKGHSHENEQIDIYFDGNHLPFKNEIFDSVFCSEVFEHIFDLEGVLRELSRVLKKGGAGLFTVPFAWDEHEIPYDFGRYSSYGIRFLLEKQGFEVVKLKKSTKFLETVFQYWNLYIYYILYTKNKYLNVIINMLFIAPFTILGIIISAIFPNKNTLYNNNIILVRKKSE